MFRLFRKKEPKFGGVIAYLKLENFWRTLSDDDRQFIRKCYGLALGRYGKRDEYYVDGPKSKEAKLVHPSQFLYSYAGWALNDKRYSLADKLINEALRINPPTIERHFALNTAIELTYKLRDDNHDAIERCIDYCIEDINLTPELLMRFKEEGVTIPNIPSFQRLAIIYEKQGRYNEAIKVCKLAIKYGLDDNTKSGFNGRIERLYKKLSKNTKENCTFLYNIPRLIKVWKNLKQIRPRGRN